MLGTSRSRAARTLFPIAASLAVTAALLVPCAGAHAQIFVQNASFEDNSSDFTTYPGYVNDPGNATIAGWLSNNNNSGLNNESTGYPFANNGTLPDGPTVAFLQSFSSEEPTTLSQNLSGFVIGQQYSVSFFANSRESYDTPNLTVSLGDVDLFRQDITTVGDTNPYHEITTDLFTATSTTATLTFSARLNSSAGSGDSAVLLDAVRVNGVSSAAAPEPGSCSLALAGFAPALGVLAYRRRRKSVP